MDNRSWDNMLAVIKGQKPDNPPIGFIIDSPWIPGWYGISNVSFYASDEQWFESNKKAIETFPDAWFIPGFWSEYGMCTEPSAYGARMIWLENNLPHAEKVLKSIDDVGSLPHPNVRTDGLLPFVIHRLQANQDRIKAMGHQIRFAVTRGPLNVASFLMGTTEFMMSLAMNPDEAKVLINKITDFICEWVVYQKECFPSIDGLFVLDDLIGFVGDYEFSEFVIPAFKKIFAAIDSKVRLLHNDAQGLITARNLKEMDVNMFNFSFEHSMSEIRDLAGPDVVLLGNIPPRDVLAAATPAQVKEAVRKCMGEITDHRHVIWSCGGGMPPDVSSENIAAFIEAVKDLSK